LGKEKRPAITTKFAVAEQKDSDAREVFRGVGLSSHALLPSQDGHTIVALIEAYPALDRYVSLL
jgi:hypothetical protein